MAEDKVDNIKPDQSKELADSEKPTAEIAEVKASEPAKVEGTITDHDRTEHAEADRATGGEVEDGVSKATDKSKVDTKAEAGTGSKGHGQDEKGTEKEKSSVEKVDGHRRKTWTKVDYRKNIISDPASQPETDDPEQIRKQVEFYFSDSNLPLDRFLFNQVGGSQNKAISIKMIHSFKRMRRFQPYEAVVAALRDSSFLEVTDEEEVRRKVPLTDATNDTVEDNIRIFEDQAAPRSIYAKGFGREDSTTQFDIEAFFLPYGPVNAIRLRRTQPDKKFKGSVFVEFDSEKTRDAFLALDPKPKYQGRELLILGKKEYCEKKAEEIKSGRLKPNYRRNNTDRKLGGPSRSHVEEKDWKRGREEFQRNGFRDSRDKGGRGRGRGRGRGGRDGGHGGRDRRRDDETEDDKDAPKKLVDENGVPVTHTEKSKNDTENGAADDTEKTTVKEDVKGDGLNKDVLEVTEDSKKRAREDDGIQPEEVAEKKVKTGVEVQNEVEVA